MHKPEEPSTQKAYKPRKPRAEIALEVEMVISGSPSTRHITRNVGLGGVLIDSGSEPLPEAGTEVALNFPGLHTIRAKVLRANDQGIALLFGELRFDDASSLKKLLWLHAV